MTVTFNSHDREVVFRKLEAAGVTVHEGTIESVLYNVRAALLQQFDEQADYAINEFEAA